MERGEIVIEPQPKKTRGRPSHASGRKEQEQLLSIALEEFSTNGYDGASLRSITKKASVDPALISYHFGSKLDLWKAVVDQTAAHLLQQMRQRAERITEQEPDVQKQLEALLHEFCDLNVEIPQFGMFIALESTRKSERFDYIVEKLAQPINALFMPFVEQAMAESKIPKQDPGLFLFLLLHAILVPISQQLIMHQFSELPKQPELFKQTLKGFVAQIFLSHSR